jgi:beta-glucosidase/6-phospho-beta-glucosidase/beta-galactosidase
VTVPRTASSLLLALLALVFAAPAHASRTMEIGLQDDAVFLQQSGYGRQAAFDRAQEIGVTVIRANMIWSRVLLGNQAEQRSRPAKPRYDWVQFDQLIDEARARGLKVELTLTGPVPRWASGARKVGTRSPSAAAFARFAADVAKRYKGKVVRYSIWNEPN